MLLSKALWLKMNVTQGATHPLKDKFPATQHHPDTTYLIQPPMSNCHALWEPGRVPKVLRAVM